MCPAARYPAAEIGMSGRHHWVTLKRELRDGGEEDDGSLVVEVMVRRFLKKHGRRVESRDYSEMFRLKRSCEISDFADKIYTLGERVEGVMDMDPLEDAVRLMCRWHYRSAFEVINKFTLTVEYLVPGEFVETEDLPERVLISGNERETGCVVCLGELLLGTYATKLPCSHLFHRRCIATWLPRQPVCPLCRAPYLGSLNLTE